MKLTTSFTADVNGRLCGPECPQLVKYRWTGNILPEGNLQCAECKLFGKLRGLDPLFQRHHICVVLTDQREGK